MDTQQQQNQQQPPAQPAAAAGSAIVPDPPFTPTAAAAIVPQTGAMLSPFAASTKESFALAQRMATALSDSSIVPQVYRGNVANCMIAMEYAARLGVGVLALMQNLDIIQGKPSLSSKFLIASVNASGRFTPIRFEWAGEPGKDSWACRARAKDRSSGELCEGPWITWAMANKEGWATKNGSKWKTMPELMFCYRAAAFWARLYCPEISIGFQTTEEALDVYGEASAPNVPLPSQLTPGGAKGLEAVLNLQRTATDAVVDAETDDGAPAAPPAANDGSAAAAAQDPSLFPNEKQQGKGKR